MKIVKLVNYVIKYFENENVFCLSVCLFYQSKIYYCMFFKKT